ncbi:MAG TPA: winged helix DNA-binding domain-containing protein [Trebonia sp.]|nr:winged helix DNA-binding domain-containing protein [Trebonia sp.]
MTRKVTVAQRRARLAARHHLAAAAESVTAAAEAMVALHATDPVTVYLSAWARTGCARGDVEGALYEARGIVRMLGMRRTMFVLPAPLVPVVQAACTDDVARRLRRKLERDLERLGGITDAGKWLRDVGDGVVAVLTSRGSASGAELAEDEPRLRTQLLYAPDKSYGGLVNITSRVLMLLSAEGLIVRGHRRGGWSSGQFTWYPASVWLGGESGRGGTAGPARGGAGDGGTAAAAARAELARRWLLAFGPAPASDLRWWAGWTGAQAKAALAALPVTDVDLDGHPGVMLADDDVLDDEPAPVAALLPGLDPTPMGWQQRDWFLGPHGSALFDRTGNIGPTVWWEGRIIGGWAQRASGEIVCRVLEDAGSAAAAAVEAGAERLGTWLGSARVTPRFRTPLERELSA